MSTTRGPAWLFVPGDRPERFAKAVATGTDQVICDLEDAVAPDDKQSARGHVADWLAGGGSAWVRINGAGTEWHRDDVAALAGCDGLRGVVMPKVESGADLALVRERLAVPVAALVESALAIERLSEVLAIDGVERLVLGTVDLALDLGCAEDSEVVAQARCRLVTASRAAGRPAPVDGVTRTLRDPEIVGADARRSRRDGFAGKLAVHPAQVDPIRAAFVPSTEELTWAHNVVAAAGRDGRGAHAVSGGMVDAPVLARAQRILGHHPSGVTD